jgi:biotin-dependent carboxylase-like uncharacterized protein
VKGLEVVRTGIVALIADRGRYGYTDIGITQSGMSDRYSGAWANKLLGNAPNDAALEIALGGMELVSHIHTCIALTGANANLMINSRSKRSWRSHEIKPGDIIRIGMATRGQRMYLAVKGGFDTPLELGSRSTTPKEGLGATLTAGDTIPCGEYHCRTQAFVPHEFIPDFGESFSLRVLLGYQRSTFDTDVQDLFFSSEYKVTHSTDRMGCRLSGKPLKTSAEIISEPISYGTIQIPRDGQPIVLLNERQTIGGYPKIGTLIPMDAYMLSQAQPGTTVRFKKIELGEATEITKKLYGFLAE